MTKVVEAIYADGVLKPVEPLELPEQQRVELTMRVISDDTRSADNLRPDVWPKMETTPQARQAALDELFEETERMDFRLTGPLPTRERLHERF